MPQFLLELFSEEIPARMQAGAARDLQRLAAEGLAQASLAYRDMQAFAGSRRLTLVIDGLPIAQADRVEERKGPRTSAPDAAIEGFLRSTGLARGDLIERGGAYVAVLHRLGQPTATLLAALVDAIVRRFPWPKSMVWGTGVLRWVRPLHRILCVFDGEIVPLEIDGLVSDDMSEGHRVMGVSEGGIRPFRARNFHAYGEALASRFVVLDVNDRKQRILDGARALCMARGLELVEDAGLLEEVAGMVEWPVPLLGDMDPRFLALPPEVIRTTMRTHQRYFAVRAEGSGGALSPHFLTVANIEAADGGVLITAGNGRVLSARLDDARFFWDEDRKASLESRLETLNGVTFHARLGTMRERARRLEILAATIAGLIGADQGLAAQAGRLAKADLATAMVGEFPELQGVMGGYYARAEGLDSAVSDAIVDHYKPQGPGDRVPTAPISVAVALADKMDTIVGFFGIGEKPTGSRDPFALRRAALGVIRIIVDNELRLGLAGLTALASTADQDPAEVLAFFADRLKVLLRDSGARHDLVDAVFALGDDDLLRITRRLKALEALLGAEDGVNLLAGYKRANNILSAEEKKGGLPEGAAVRVTAPAQQAALHDALDTIGPRLQTALAAEDFAAAMGALAGLRGPVDAFFEAVLVNADDPGERANRLRLLARVRREMSAVADFSLISG